MIPIVLRGHERPLTFIKFNDDGDILFTVGKDTKVLAWRASDGKLLGSYEGLTAAVYTLDVDHNCTFLVAGCSGGFVYFWDVTTGTVLTHFEIDKSRVLGLALNHSNDRLAAIVYHNTGMPPSIYIYTLPPPIDASAPPSLERRDWKAFSPVPQIQTFDNQFSSLNGPNTMVWDFLDEQLLVGCSDGVLRVFEVETMQVVKESKLHAQSIHQLTMNQDSTLMLSASADGTAKLVDPETFEALKTYKTDRNVNSASFSPMFEHVICGGGLDAKDVTVSDTSQTKFGTHFYNMITQKEFGLVGGHFGPINCLAFNPSGRGFASASEDGTVRIFFFDPDYYFKSDKDEKELLNLVSKGGSVKA